MKIQRKLVSATHLGTTCIAATLLIFLSACDSKVEESAETTVTENTNEMATTSASSEGIGFNEKQSTRAANPDGELSREYALDQLQAVCADVYVKFRNRIFPLQSNGWVRDNPNRELSTLQQSLVDTERSRFFNMKKDGWINGFEEERHESGPTSMIIITVSPSDKMEELMLPSDRSHDYKRYIVGKKCPTKIDGILARGDAVAEVRFYNSIIYNGLSKYLTPDSENIIVQSAIFKKYDDGWRFDSLSR